MVPPNQLKFRACSPSELTNTHTGVKGAGRSISFALYLLIHIQLSLQGRSHTGEVGRTSIAAMGGARQALTKEHRLLWRAVFLFLQILVKSGGPSFPGSIWSTLSLFCGFHYRMF
ncbi:unnamed protein product [Lepidochelys kempii]